MSGYFVLWGKHPEQFTCLVRAKQQTRHFLLCIFGAALTLTPCLSFAAGSQISDSALQQIETLQQEKANRTPAQRKINSELLMATKRSAGEVLFDALPDLRTGRELARNLMVEVDIRAEVSANLLDAINAIGGTVVNQHPKFHAIRASVPLSEVEYLAGFPEVSNIRAADVAMPRKINTSEGVVRHAADTVHASVDGSGTLTCVMADGIDSAGLSIGSGDLPDRVSVLIGQAGSGDEGTAMLEIVYDMAPGTSFVFATASSGQAQFAQNILDLGAAGCDIIVDDYGYLNEVIFQDGIIAQAVNTVVDTGVQYYSAAGNDGNMNDGTSGVYEGDFVAGALPNVPTEPGSTSAHNFGGGSVFNTITKDPPASTNRFILKWSDPDGGSSNDYDLYMLNPAGDTVIAKSTNIQSGSQSPIEIISSPSNDTGFKLVIVAWNSPQPRFLHLNTYGGRLAFATAGQTYGHPATEKAFGVAAVNQASAGGVTFDGSESIRISSSDGPRRIFYEPDDTPITPGDFLASGGRLIMKPDITAANGVATSIPKFNPFFGTSAAAPHAAGIAALLLDKSPKLTREGTKFLFSVTALDIEAPGPDRDSGYGIIMADDSLDALDPVCAGQTPTLSTAVVTKALTCTGSTSVTLGGSALVDSAGKLTVNTPNAIFKGDFTVLLGGTLRVDPPP